MLSKIVETNYARSVGNIKNPTMGHVTDANGKIKGGLKMNQDYCNGTGNAANTQSGYSLSFNWCGNRLPCGWCKELHSMCPLQGTTYPTYPTFEVTCEAKQEVNDVST